MNEDRERTNRALAHLANTINPNWHTQGLTTTLGRLNNRPLPEVALATLIAATTRQDQTTPAVIMFEGPHWDRARQALGQGTQPATPAPNPAPTTHCQHQLRVADCQPCTHNYQQAAQRGAAKARQALKTPPNATEHHQTTQDTRP